MKSSLLGKECAAEFLVENIGDCLGIVSTCKNIAIHERHAKISGESSSAMYGDAKCFFWVQNMQTSEDNTGRFRIKAENSNEYVKFFVSDSTKTTSEISEIMAEGKDSEIRIVEKSDPIPNLRWLEPGEEVNIAPDGGSAFLWAFNLGDRS